MADEFPQLALTVTGKATALVNGDTVHVLSFTGPNSVEFALQVNQHFYARSMLGAVYTLTDLVP